MPSVDHEYQVLVLVFPASGHFTPMVSFVNQFAKNKNVKITFPGSESCRKAIENTGAEYVPIRIVDVLNDYDPMPTRKRSSAIRIMNRMMCFGSLVLDDLLELCERVQFDLIIYDFFTFYANWLMEMLNRRHRQGLNRRPAPPAVKVSPSFMHGPFPNAAEQPFFTSPGWSLEWIASALKFAYNYAAFCWWYGLRIQNPRTFIQGANEPLNICCIAPDVHPRAHLYPKCVKFVGDFVSEEVRLAGELEEPLKSFLAPFRPVNPLNLTNDLGLDDQALELYQSGQKLVFASFGTLFNRDLNSFMLIIRGFLALATSGCKLKLLLSVGDKTHAQFEAMIERQELAIPDNVLIMDRVPQLDVLKRASVFITHAGQNGTSESIHYGVPMIFIPIIADQPAVAYRCADELGLGVRLDYESLTAQKVTDALVEVLGDKCYLERVLLHAKLARKHHGVQQASKLVLEHLEKIKC